MAIRLVIYKKGAKVREIDLDSAKTYTLGRDKGNDIVLESKGVSRHHAELKYENHQWRCSLTSRFGYLVVDGKNQESVNLQVGSSFEIPPFDLRASAPPGDARPGVHVPIPTAQSTTGEAVDKTEVVSKPASKPEVTSEPTVAKTRTGHVDLKAMLWRIEKGGKPLEEITLGVGKVEGGRSRSCQIKLDDSRASRKHFVIYVTPGECRIKHVGASLPTKVNGQPVQNEPLHGGDIIKVGKDRFKFEWINPIFESLPVPQNAAHLPATVSPAGAPAIAPPKSHGPAVLKVRAVPLLSSMGINLQRLNNSNLPQQKRLIYFGGGILLLILFLSLLPGKTHKKDLASQNPNARINPEQAALTKLSSEQRKYLDDTYNLALNLYTTGKYDLAALEVGKVLQIVPNYKDAKTIQALCQQALEIKKQRDQQAREQQEQEELSRKVNSILDQCDQLFKAKRYERIEGCVSRISDMDPDNARGQFLISSAKAALDERQERREAEAERARQTVQAKRYFSEGEKAFKLQRYPAAIENFQKVTELTSGEHQGIHNIARVEIEKAKQALLNKSETITQKGRSALDAKNYKKAVSFFDQALIIAPENGDAKIMRDRAIGQLHMLMKDIYAESVIDENLGNVDSAKRRWQMIIDQDVRADDYYQKAQDKLNKYDK